MSLDIEEYCRMRERSIANEFKMISKEYAYNDSIFSEDSPKVKILKKIINKYLNQVDRTIILLYIDCQSYRKLGEKMGMGHMTIRREVIRIKNLIIEQYEKLISD